MKPLKLFGLATMIAFTTLTMNAQTSKTSKPTHHKTKEAKPAPHKEVKMHKPN